ncbi:sugar phosphate isomerase/epimerase family protein [Halovenus sp. HT40]|uniref:sugar phosphate isomerase/epimerase family protein n=1 Tax=Halovenus sp. HT40 TaxID=3126691 RepID=UPI00300E846D
MPKLYASTTCLGGRSYAETIDAYRTAGIDAVELGYCHDTGFDVGTLVTQCSFDLTAHNYFRPVPEEFVLNIASQDDSLRQRSVEYVRDSIDFCAQHEIDRYTFHAGFRADPDENLRFDTAELSPVLPCMETFVDSLETLVPYAERRGVSVAIENNVVEPRHLTDEGSVVLLADPTEFEMLFDRIEIDVLLDIGHLKVAAETLDFDAEEFLDIVTPQVSHIHLHTNDGTHDAHQPVRPGCWAFDVWKRFNDTPTTVEARFDTLEELIEYRHRLIEH